MRLQSYIGLQLVCGERAGRMVSVRFVSQLDVARTIPYCGCSRIVGFKVKEQESVFLDLQSRGCFLHKYFDIIIPAGLIPQHLVHGEACFRG